MTSKHFFSLAVIGSGLAAVGLGQFGCGGGGGTATGSGGATASSTSHASGHTVSSSASTSTSGSTSGGTGGMGGPNTIDMAQMTTVNASPAVTGTLKDTKTPDFYSFAGKAGERILIQVLPTNLTAFTDVTLIDPTIALIDSTKNTMAPLTYQNGATPYGGQEAVLYVQLPADGTYYLQVSDCNGFFMSGCPNDPTKIVDFSYTVVIADTSKLNSPEVVAAATQDGTSAKADKLVYKAGKTAGTFIAAPLGGDFKSATDTQVFSFTPPATATGSAGGRPRADFYFQNIGSSQGGDLSDANAKAWITSDAAGTKILASADQTDHDPKTGVPLDLSIPYTAGSTYYLFVKNTQAAGSPMKDFYFTVNQLNGLIDVAEKEVFGMHTNDTSGSPQMLAAQGSAKTLFTADGDISAPASATTPDVDWYTFAVPQKVTQYGYQCDSARSGSGLGGFKLELFQSDGTTPIGTAAVETTTADMFMNPVALPTGVAPGNMVFMKLSAATQDATNTGTQYRCYVFFQ